MHNIQFVALRKLHDSDARDAGVAKEDEFKSNKL